MDQVQWEGSTQAYTTFFDFWYITKLVDTPYFKGTGYGDFRFRKEDKISLNKLNGLKNSDSISNTVNKHWGGSKGESNGNTGFRDEISNQNNQILEDNGRAKLVNIDDKIVPYNTNKIEKFSGKNHGFRDISIDTNEIQKEHKAIDATQGILEIKIEK